MENFELDFLEEEVLFFHDAAAEKNKKRRRNKAVKWRKDRTTGKRYSLVDKKLCKRSLHRQNRKDDDICSSTYYKTGWSLKSVCWGLT